MVDSLVLSNRVDDNAEHPSLVIWLLGSDKVVMCVLDARDWKSGMRSLSVKFWEGRLIVVRDGVLF